MINNWRDYPLQPGTVWQGRYRIEKMLGMGSYGQAYLCLDQASNELVLLKRNKPSKGKTGIALLRRESELMGTLDHPQIPKWLHYGKRNRDEALIMEYIEGYNLEQVIYEQNETYTAEQALKLLEALLEPLRYLHERGYVHRDVRIPNVLIRNGAVYLIDLGLACGIGEELPNDLRLALGEDSGAMYGAAIKRRMRSANIASDWFGLGHLFLFAMYAGYTPPDDAEERSWEEELILEPEVKAFARKLLNDENAWETTEQCEQELKSLLAQLGTKQT
ncbi:serine/threonine protein kinase [Paenibacillus sp. GCM10027627]